MPRTVAVLGAGGIGRHHANWWHLEGAQVVAILGRTNETVHASAAKLKAIFGFKGAVFTDLTTLLREADPEIVDVCSPADRHFEMAQLALKDNRQVLCEKPLVFDETMPHTTLLTQADTLVDLALARNLTFGLCSQFAVAGRTCNALLQARSPAKLHKIRMELRSPVRGRQPSSAQTWIDLGPHLIAALQTLLPDYEPDWLALQAQATGHDANYSFTMKPHAGPNVTVHLSVGFTTDVPANVRRITLNDTAFDLTGEAGPDHVFRIRYRSDDGIDDPHPDPMRLLIREFLAGAPPLGPEAARQNQRLLLHLLDALPTVI